MSMSLSFSAQCSEVKEIDPPQKGCEEALADEAVRGQDSDLREKGDERESRERVSPEPEEAAKEGPAQKSDRSRAEEPSSDESISDLDIDDPHQLGRLGEILAARYLSENGYEILKRNWRCRSGEADIVARSASADETVLVEVKTRRGDSVFPEEAVDESKLARYRNISLEYLLQHGELDAVRFDVIAISIPKPGLARLRHIIGASSWDS